MHTQYSLEHHFGRLKVNGSKVYLAPPICIVSSFFLKKAMWLRFVYTCTCVDIYCGRRSA